MAVTIQQIAEAAQVSRGTVDRVLHGRGRVSAEVSERVLEIARELGYQLNTRSRNNNKDGDNVKIGVITQLAKASFMDEIKRGIKQAESELKLRGIELLVRESQAVCEKEQLAAIDELVAAGAKGLAVMPLDSAPVRAKLKEVVEDQGLPVVTFNSDIAGVGRSCFVGLDNWKSGTLAAGLMGMLTGGTGKILIITGHFSNSANNMRVDGFVEEARNAFPQLEIVGVQCSFDNGEEVERIVLNTLSAYADLDGILIVSGGQEGLASVFSKAGLIKRPYVIVYDLLPSTKQLLEEGSADFLIDQEGYVQGYQALLALADLLQGASETLAEYQYTDINIRTKYNL